MTDARPHHDSCLPRLCLVHRPRAHRPHGQSHGPSAEARERLIDLPPGVFSAAPPSVGLGGYRDLVVKTIAICKCLVNANQLTSGRVKMIILPMLIKEGGASPCRFIAVEE